MWKLNFKTQQPATVATAATKTSFSDNKTEGVATVAVVAGECVLRKTQYPPLPKSVAAVLDYLRRTKFEKPLSPKMQEWLERDSSIEAYEQTCERIDRRYNRDE